MPWNKSCVYVKCLMKFACDLGVAHYVSIAKDAKLKTALCTMFTVQYSSDGCTNDKKFISFVVLFCRFSSTVE